MKYLQTFILVFIISFACQAQTEITLFGYIYNAKTEAPLAYVNIGFVNEKVGTVTNEYGRFDLVYNENNISPNSILQVSSIGFETIKIKASDFYKQMNLNNIISLEPKTYSLDEVIVVNDLRKEKNVGSLKLDNNTVGYWLNAEALGGEIATKMTIDKDNTKLHELLFYVNKNNSGNFKVRVNVYEYKNGLPGEILLKKNIYHSITTQSGIESINLDPYNIIVSDDIVVSLELIKVNGNYIDFEIAGTQKKSHSFTKQISHDSWNRHNEVGMAFKLKTSYPSPKGKVLFKKRNTPQRITLYWDSSLIMEREDRDLNSEMELLKKYLKQLDYASVEVIKFSAKILERKEFRVTNKTIDDIEDYLINTNSDGISSYEGILKNNAYQADVVLLFSNGHTFLEPLQQEVYVPTFTINSMTDANHIRLQAASFYGDGHYLDLTKSSVKECLQKMLEEHNDNEDYESSLETETGFVKGKVSSDSLFLPGARITLKNTLIQTISDSQGNFKIQSKRGDVLTVEALGMQTKELVVPNSKYFEIQIEPDATTLEEVLLYGKVKLEEETVITPYGKRNIDAVGFAYDELDMSTVNSSHHNLDQIAAKLPGVIVYGVGQEKRYMFVRNLSKKSEVPIIVIDGIIYSQNEGLDKLPPIDIQTIESVKAIKSVVGTNRYGGLGAYGAIIIETNLDGLSRSNNSVTTSLLATNNDYDDPQISTITQAQIQPSYMTLMQKASSFEEAKKIYLNQKKYSANGTIDFYCNTATYFLKWNKPFALSVLSNIAAVAPNNTKALRTLAYKLEEMQEFNQAKFVYERIKKIRPAEAQVYRDLAQSYEATGSYQKAMDLYKLMLANQIENIDFTAIHNVLANDLIHLIMSNRSKLNIKDIPNDYLKADFKLDSRIVFEWNDPNAEFEVQFVNPNNKFFKWSNTINDNKEGLFNKVINGHSVEEYIIDDALPSGTWMINIESINTQPSKNPTYLKYTLYKNFGLPSESKEVKVFELNTYQEKVTLDKISL